MQPWEVDAVAGGAGGRAAAIGGVEDDFVEGAVVVDIAIGQGADIEGAAIGVEVHGGAGKGLNGLVEKIVGQGVAAAHAIVFGQHGHLFGGFEGVRKCIGLGDAVERGDQEAAAAGHWQIHTHMGIGWVLRHVVAQWILVGVRLQGAGGVGDRDDAEVGVKIDLGDGDAGGEGGQGCLDVDRAIQVAAAEGSAAVFEDRVRTVAEQLAGDRREVHRIAQQIPDQHHAAEWRAVDDLFEVHHKHPARRAWVDGGLGRALGGDVVTARHGWLVRG